ncbi:MXAN_6640 family putative metalloprotease [Melioribacter sp. Ez-97]|uniref:MXAN_6640 family putative metalloprotease n=1 Tax=Melioribacter sp. Ez-97 TaxID=3423434 RepID=UPI003ED8B23B
MKKLFFLLALFITIDYYAQNLDSLYNYFLYTRGRYESGLKSAVYSPGDYVKCGTGIYNQIKENYSNFSIKQRQILSSYLSRPQTDTSFVTKSGFFRIHFNKSGLHKPAYDLNLLSEALDSVYNYEVNILGYPPPPKDYGGGDDRYDVYIQNMSGGLYGETRTEDLIGTETYTSYIVIDNDFDRYYTQGIDGARVSAAHEFHHAIQVGNYIYRSTDQYYHELSSTAMEEFVFDDINDYYAYIYSYFVNTNRSFSQNSGYNLAIWNIFLKDRFGFEILKRTWELMKEERALYAIADAIKEYGSDFKTEFAEFSNWIYFTGYRSKPGKYFEEAENYPVIKPLMNIDFDKPVVSVDINTRPASVNYISFVSLVDTLTAILSNSDVTNGVQNPSSELPLKYFLADHDDGGYRWITDNYYSKLVCQSSFLITENSVLNNRLIDSTTVITREEFPFPQPFNYATDNFIYLPSPRSLSGMADLYVFSIDMDLIFSGELRVFVSDKNLIKWDALDKSGERLSSGIYFYVIKADDETKKGKFVVINE